MSATPAARSPVLPSPEQKSASVQRMFDAIAPRYDLLNHLLSLNIDKVWRRRTIAELLKCRAPVGKYLDACAGTLDLSVALAQHAHFSGDIVASDFSLPMLQHGYGKSNGEPIVVACADALRLPFGDATFDGAMVAFGVRNLADLDGGLVELRRVLKRGGRLAVLEFCTPTWQPFRGAYLFYFRHVLPLIGRMISKHGTAYDYLPASVLEFPAPAELAKRMRAAGFSDVRWKVLSGGIAAVHIADV
jgi:demethylmenaquinone methyltransferase/2-methoxy-6-polyprenyl-1,4-benzoquinol methylase